MCILLTKQFVCNSFDSIIQGWKQAPPFRYPFFIIERSYVDCFYFYFSRLPVNANMNLIPIIEKQFEEAWNRAFRRICKTLEQYNADGSVIFDLMYHQQFIPRKVRTAFNKGVPGKSPKGLKRGAWEDYNHWVLATTYWKGFIHSQEPGFKIIIPELADDPIEVLLTEKYKPLWGMAAAAKDSGMPCIGDGGDDIKVYPFASCEVYYNLKK